MEGGPKKGWRQKRALRLEEVHGKVVDKRAWSGGTGCRYQCGTRGSTMGECQEEKSRGNPQGEWRMEGKKGSGWQTENLIKKILNQEEVNEGVLPEVRRRNEDT